MNASSTAEAPDRLEVGRQPISSIAHPSARRVQRAVAGAIVVVPLAGTAWAVARAWESGLGTAEIALLVVGYASTLLGITVGFHRHFAHNAFRTGKAMRAVLAILGSMAGQGPLYWWVATHRRHHRFSDREGDPHSPQLARGSGLSKVLRGFWQGHVGWMFSEEITSWAVFAPDLLRDRGLFFFHRTYFLWLLLGLAMPAFAGWAMIGGLDGLLSGLLWGGLVRMCLVDHALWLVGSVSHMWGTRPFRAMTRDWSANNHLVAAVSFGEGLQNNHHAFPNSAWHALRWWEPDVSAWMLRLLEKVGLVWGVKRPTPSLVEAARTRHTEIIEL